MRSRALVSLRGTNISASGDLEPRRSAGFRIRSLMSMRVEVQLLAELPLFPVQLTTWRSLESFTRCGIVTLPPEKKIS
jgi:hypothetical protein